MSAREEYGLDGFSSPPPAYNETYHITDDAGTGNSTARPAWQQPPDPAKLPGVPLPHDLFRGGNLVDRSRPQNVPWAVPSGPMMTTGDNMLGHPLQASYYPPMGLLPGYPPPPQYVGFAPAPGQYQPQVVVLGRNHEVVQLQSVENFCGHIVLACFVTWFCNIVLGVVAFALAVKASSTAVSNPRSAHQFGRASYSTSVIGITITIIVIIVIVTIASNLKNSTPCPRYTYNYRCFNMYCSTTCSRSFCDSNNGYYTTSGFCYYNI